MLFSFTFAFTVLLPPILLHLGPFLCGNPRRKFFTFGVKSRDERGEGKNAKVFTLNPLCNSEICEVGEDEGFFLKLTEARVMRACAYMRERRC